jgi:hypothetical protein
VLRGWQCITRGEAQSHELVNSFKKTPGVFLITIKKLPEEWHKERGIQLINVSTVLDLKHLPHSHFNATQNLGQKKNVYQCPRNFIHAYSER